MELNYYSIGQRIKDRRMNLGLSQETLADRSDLTTAHISHIENGHTKLSLPALVSIANALNVSANDLLYDNLPALYDTYDKDFKDLLDDCTVHEKRIIFEAASSLKAVMKNKNNAYM